MDLIEFLRLAFFVFNAVCLLILAMHPSEEDLADYEDWIAYFDSAARKQLGRGG